MQTLSDIILTNHTCSSMTVVSNIFIDQYMPGASGEFVKVYLYLLRCANAGQSITIPILGKHLNHSEQEINKSLAYWEQSGLLHLTLDQQKKILSIQLLPVQPINVVKEELIDDEQTDHSQSMVAAALSKKPDKVSYTPKDLSAKIEKQGLSQLIFVAETYLGKALTPTDLNTILYFCDNLKFSPEMVEFLIEHCVTINKKSMRYMEAVALSWYEQGIDSVPKAKSSVKSYNTNYFSVMKAFGLSGRNPGKVEADYIKKWLDEFGFTLEIVIEACNRTITSISQPSFPYTDRILTDWYQSKVRNLKDIKQLDTKHESTRKKEPVLKKTAQTPNKFHNFEQRSYDYADLEQRFINKANNITKESR